jgi:hypothetical protein
VTVGIELTATVPTRSVPIRIAGTETALIATAQGRRTATVPISAMSSPDKRTFRH